MNRLIFIKYLSKCSCPLRLLSNIPKKSNLNLTQCYKILGVPACCTDADLKKAYLSLVKQLHPDSSNQNRGDDFQRVQEAYESVVIARKHDFNDYDEQEEDGGKFDFDIKHTAPQHRQYLEYCGVGSGTPGQRQRQYQQLRVQQAFENVAEHRVDKAKLQSQLNNEESNNQLVQQDNMKFAKKIQTRSFIDRLVEDLIQESFSKGEFENLDGKGKPLPNRGSDVNPFIDLATHNLNRVLIQNGYKPEWAALEKEIREYWQFTQNELLLTRRKIGHYPFQLNEEELLWNRQQLVFNQRVEEINRMIDKFNLLAPTLRQQMVHISFEKYPLKILEDSSFAYTIDDDEVESRNCQSNHSGYAMRSHLQQGISFADIGNAFTSFWSELKSIRGGGGKK